MTRAEKIEAAARALVEAYEGPGCWEDMMPSIDTLRIILSEEEGTPADTGSEAGDAFVSGWWSGVADARKALMADPRPSVLGNAVLCRADDRIRAISPSPATPSEACEACGGDGKCRYGNCEKEGCSGACMKCSGSGRATPRGQP